jgi:hypothetical protein
MAFGAQAQVDPDLDSLGLYYDTGATENCGEFSLGEWANLYIVLTRASINTGLQGADFSLFYPQEDTPGWFLIESTASGGFDNCDHGEGPRCPFFPDPLPWTPAIVLKTIMLAYMGPLEEPSCLRFFLGPSQYFGDDLMYYRSAGEFYPMYPSTGSYEIPVAVANCDCGEPIPVERGSWGILKALYR